MPDNLLSGEIAQSSLSSWPDKAAVAWTARLLGDTWLLLIICELMEGKKRFGEIQEGVGKINPKTINPQTLSGRLKMLEKCGMITRKAYAEIPPRVEYDLTEKGHCISEVVQAMATFGKTYMNREGPEMLPCPTDCPAEELS